MTREEKAVETLEMILEEATASEDAVCYVTSYDADALDMAIKAIKALEHDAFEVIHCWECKHHHYDSKDIPYCDRINYGYGWKDDDFCSKAERK